MFRTSGIVVGGDFVDRREILGELSEGVGSNNFVLSGPRRIGKSSLLAELERRVGERFVVTNFSVAEVVPRTHANFLNLLAKRILASHLKQNGANFSEVLRMSFKDLLGAFAKTRVDVLDLLTIYLEREPDVADLAKSTFELPERLARESNKDCLVMLDELPLLIRLSSGKPLQEDVDFMWALRDYMQRAKRVHYVISGSQVGMVKKLSVKDDSPFFGTFVFRALGGIDEESAAAFLRRVKKEVEVDDALLKKLIDYTGRVPLYLAAFGNVLLAEGRRRRLQEKDFGVLSKKFFVDLSPQFEELLGKITSPVQKNILGVMALNNLSETSEVAKIVGKSYPAVYVNMERLELFGYLEKTGAGRFDFSDKLLKEYLRLKASSF